MGRFCAKGLNRDELNHQKTSRNSHEKTDRRKRDFLKFLLLNIPLLKSRAFALGMKTETDEREGLFELVLGRKVRDRERKRILKVGISILERFYEAKILKIASGFVQTFWDVLEPLILKIFKLSVEKIGSFQNKKMILEAKKERALFVLTKTALLFPRYCLDESWKDIGYDGPLKGRVKFPRPSEPYLDVEKAERDIKTDVCVIGSGAGGSMVALKLSGKVDVVVLEAGRHRKPEEFSEREDDMLPKLYFPPEFDELFSILLLRGRCVGGSTVHNTALFVSLPEKVLEWWSEKVPNFPAQKFSEKTQEVFNIIRPPKISEGELNNVSKICKEGFRKLGFSHFLPHHGRWNCIGAGFCELGCYWNRKFSTLLHILPEAQKSGNLRIFDGARVLGFEVFGDKVKYAIFESEGRKFRVYAKHFVLCAGAIGSALLVRRSFGRVFENLSLHPSTFCAGVFDDDVWGWRGIPIGVICDEFLKGDKGFLLMPYFSHPATFSISIGGFGEKHFDVMKKYRRIAVCSVLLHDRGEGHITDRRFSKFFYKISDDDERILREGIRRCAEVLFEAGAKKVILPNLFEVVVCRSMKEVEREVERLGQGNTALLSVHPQGTLPFSIATDEFGRLKGFGNLWVADASLFPASSGVPPQVSVMAFAFLVSDKILDVL